eukprot:1376566-Rhodomonas_salina.1
MGTTERRVTDALAQCGSNMLMRWRAGVAAGEPHSHVVPRQPSLDIALAVRCPALTSGVQSSDTEGFLEFRMSLGLNPTKEEIFHRSVYLPYRLPIRLRTRAGFEKLLGSLLRTTNMRYLLRVRPVGRALTGSGRFCRTSWGGTATRSCS